MGVCHALSYGLSFVLGLHHGIANSIAFNHLEDVYGKAVQEFHRMVEKNKIDLPQNISKGLSSDQIEKMADIAIKLDHMWKHAFGQEWQKHVNKEKIMNWYQKM